MVFSSLPGLAGFPSKEYVGAEFYNQDYLPNINEGWHHTAVDGWQVRLLVSVIKHSKGVYLTF
jgi:hypothetical protein